MAVGKANKSALSAASFDAATVKAVKDLGKVVASGVAKRPAAAPKGVTSGYAAGKAKAQGATFGQLRTSRFGSVKSTGNAATRGAPHRGHIAAAERIIEEAKIDPNQACKTLNMIATSVELTRNSRGQFA